ncbi:hypothetical protein AO058_04395 [Salegentibacter sp. T436]|nr:hypothetical protein AO058_04395 [Salegentibacter sp. T436]
MEENKRIEDLLIDIKGLLGTNKKVMNVEDLAQSPGFPKVRSTSLRISSLSRWGTILIFVRNFSTRKRSMLAPGRAGPVRCFP